MRYGSRSKTKKRTVKIKGSVSFALLTVRLKNGTVKKTENGTDTERYGHGSGDKFGPPIVLGNLNPSSNAVIDITAELINYKYRCLSNFPTSESETAKESNNSDEDDMNGSHLKKKLDINVPVIILRKSL